MQKKAHLTSPGLEYEADRIFSAITELKPNEKHDVRWDLENAIIKYIEDERRAEA